MAELDDFREFSKLPDEPDDFLQTFLGPAGDFCLRSAGLDNEPTDPNELAQFRLAKFSIALHSYQERSFPRPGNRQAVYDYAIGQLAGLMNPDKTLIITKAEA